MARPELFKIENHAVSANPRPNGRVGIRFDANGMFLPEPGNTVVRHVVPGSRTEDALIELRRRLRDLPWGDRFAYTDTASYHMTVFEGVIETRRQPESWPKDLPVDAPLEEATTYLAGRLEGFEGPGPFDMRIAEVTPFGLTLTGATDDDEKTARAWRDSLTEPFAWRSPGHDAYTFHVTLAYIVDWIPDEMIPGYKQALTELTAEIQDRIPVVELGPPALCTFADMNGFPPVMHLPGSGVEPIYEENKLFSLTG